MSYEAYDVVVVPFPFTDKNAVKRRPALVLSAASAFNRKTNHVVLAMITSVDNSSTDHASWSLDVPISDIDAAGLVAPSVVRMKLLTLDDRFVLRKAGALGANDRSMVGQALARIFPVDAVRAVGVGGSMGGSMGMVDTIGVR